MGINCTKSQPVVDPRESSKKKYQKGKGIMSELIVEDMGKKHEEVIGES